jgi:hypothetical protein
MRAISILSGAVLALVLAIPAGAQTSVTVEANGRGQTPAPTDPEPQLAQSFGRHLSVGTFLGFQSGFSLHVFGRIEDFAEGFPLQARFRVARTSVEPGSAPDARKIFINDATNGTPRESGSTWDLGLDGLYPMGARIHLFGGVRYTRFKANFKYVGGNEDFDVTSNHWGVAGGMEAEFPMSRSTSLLLSGGAEYFFSSRLTGHDTSYSPDGDNVNPRKDYTYSDADDAVDQPVLRPVVLLGVSYRLGR